jgi:hypothetical protein
MRIATALRRHTAAAATIVAVGFAAPAAAVPCALDEPPAATLLLPYFEVDLDGSLTTLLSVGSATAQATLSRVTVWSDLGVPVLWFDVYLTGWDVETINLRDILAGELPQTAPDSADPADRISPQGSLSFDTDFPGCAETMPPPPLGPDLAGHLQAALTGQPSPLEPGTCYGADYGDGRARGWLTVDVVERCGTHPPGLVSSAIGLPPEVHFGMDNVLWGDFLLVDPAENRASAASLVRLEAAPELFGDGARTFYFGKTGNTADAREPLPTVWATRFLDDPDLSGGTATSLLAWRDPGEAMAAYDCSQPLQTAYPWLLSGHEPAAFDEEENPDFCTRFPGTRPPEECDEPPSFAFHAARVEVGSPELPMPFVAGWIWADLSVEEGPTQGWLGALMGADGRYTVTVEATPLDDPCAPGALEPPYED